MQMYVNVMAQRTKVQTSK